MEQKTRLLRVPGTSKIAGALIDRVTFWKRVKRQHYLRKPPALALDVEVTRELRQRGVTTILVSDDESGTCYAVSVDRFLREAIPLERGHGSQLALPLSRWHIDDPNQPQLPGVFE